MRIRGKATNPDNVEFTVTMTATLQDWRILREQLKSEWPSSDLSRAIFDLLLQAARQFEPEEAP